MKENKIHDSDCSTNNEPAFKNGKCDCSLNLEKRLRDKLIEITKDQDELDELRSDYKDQSEWHRFMYKLRIKQYLLEEILGIE